MASRKHFTASEDDFLDLISQVYDASLDASLWNQTLISIMNYFRAEQINLRTIDPDSRNINKSYAYNRDPYWVQAYNDYYYQVDPWIKMLFNSDKPIVECTNHLLSDREYKQLEIYNDFIVPTNIHYGMGGLVSVNEDFKTYLSLQKSYNSGAFQPEQLDIFKMLVPHVNKAVLINQRTQQLEFQGHSLAQALNRINNAVLLVNERRHVLFMNTAAESFVEHHQCISVTHGGIQFRHAPQNQRFDELIANATIGKAGTSIVEAGGMKYQPVINGEVFSIVVSPLTPGMIDFDIKSNKAAMVFISNTSTRTRPAEEILTAIYQFTPAEARVVSLLCTGLSTNEICDRLQLKMNTVKTHLKSAFQKTGTRRQAELVNLINAGPAGIMHYKKLDT